VTPTGPPIARSGPADARFGSVILGSSQVTDVPSTSTPATATRRGFVGGAATCTLALAGCSGLARDDRGSPDQHWTQFGFDAANTAASPDGRGPPEEPSPAWVHTAGSYYLNSTQVLVAGDVYANAGYDGLYALAPDDGTVGWHDPTGYEPLTPALADGVVLPGRYGFRRVAADGGVDVLGRRLGYRDWQTDLSASPNTPPTVTDGTLVAGVGTTGHSPGGGRIVALDRPDGSTRWSIPVGSTVWGAPAVRDGVVYAVQRSTRTPEVPAVLYALDLADGGEHWRRRPRPAREGLARRRERPGVPRDERGAAVRPRVRRRPAHGRGFSGEYCRRENDNDYLSVRRSTAGK